MVAVAIQRGYANSTVSEVITDARVSRPTFYECFADRDACFLAAADHVQRQLLERVGEEVAAGEPQDAAQSAVAALVQFAASEPALARFAMSELTAARRAAFDARDAGIGQLAAVVARAHEAAAKTSEIPDIPPEVLIGGVYRWLAVRLRRGERSLLRDLDGLLDWVESYRTPAGTARWRTLKPAGRPKQSTFLPVEPIEPPARIPPGRSKLTRDEIAENHRQRIISAAAVLAQQKGYHDTTIEDIIKRAGIDGRAFYAQFSTKQEAMAAVHDIGFQEVMALTAGAYFTATSWPERSWEAGLVFTQFLEQNPTLAHVGFVDAYTFGPAVVQRVEDSHIAFAMLLQEGFQYTDRESLPSRAALEAIITTIIELVYQVARADGKPQMSRYLAAISHIWLAPFMGPAEASSFIAGKVGARSKS